MSLKRTKKILTSLKKTREGSSTLLRINHVFSLRTKDKGQGTRQGSACIITPCLTKTWVFSLFKTLQKQSFCIRFYDKVSVIIMVILWMTMTSRLLFFSNVVFVCAAYNQALCACTVTFAPAYKNYVFVWQRVTILCFLLEG